MLNIVGEPMTPGSCALANGAGWSSSTALLSAADNVAASVRPVNTS
jgi:hypothetical protein